MLKRRRTSTSGADDGAALVIALVFVTVLSLIVAAALSYTTVSLRNSSRRYEPARERLYGVDAAIKAAALYVATNPAALGALGADSCYAPLSYGDADLGPLTITACPKPGSFDVVEPTPWGVRLLGSSVPSRDALVLNQGASVWVNGDLSANGRVDVGNNSLAVRGGEFAATACRALQAGSISVDGTAIAQTGDACRATAPAVDPGYVSGIDENPAAATAAASCVDDVMTIAPGRWTAAVTAALDDCSTVHLQPGVHVLESVTWTVDRRVVAGELRSTVSLAGLADAPLGSACDPSVDGVMLVLAGTTSLTFAGTGTSPAEMEVCGRSVPQSGGRSPRIALYGPPEAIEFVTTPPTTMTATAASGGTGWTNGSNASAVDGSSATYADLSGGGVSTSVLTISGFTATIPNTIRSLSAALTATRSSRATTFTLAVRNSGSTSDVCTGNGTLPTASSVTTVTLTCTAALSPPLSVRFVATTSSGNANPKANISVDGVTLTFGESTSIPATTPGTTSVDTGTSGGELLVDGEVYMPASHMVLTQSRVRSALITEGIVLESLAMNSNTSSTFPPILAATNGTFADGDLVLTASIDGTPWTTCRVYFESAGYTAAASLKGCTIPR